MSEPRRTDPTLAIVCEGRRFAEEMLRGLGSTSPPNDDVVDDYRLDRAELDEEETRG